MQLTRENFIKMMNENGIFISKIPEKTFFNLKGSQIMKLLNSYFFDNTLIVSVNNGIIEEIAQPSLNFNPSEWYSEKYSKCWLENFYQIDVIYMWEYLLKDYFVRTEKFQYMQLLEFLRNSKDVDDEYTEHFHKFYYWFVARFIRYVKHEFYKHSNDFYKQKNIDVLAIDYERIFSYDPEPVYEYFNKVTNNYVKYNVKKIFGAYFESRMRFYIMYDDGEIVDKITTSRNKFDPVLAMLSINSKT